MMVIFPFEQPWYEERGVAATFVGHPMLDLFDLKAIRARGAAFRKQLGASPRQVESGALADVPLIGLLPGSRRNEITRLLPRFLAAAERIRRDMPSARFALGCAHWLTPERLAPFLKGHEALGVKPLNGQTHELMSASDYLMVASGTATLEAGLIGTPMLMAYVVSPVSAMIGKLFFDEMQDMFCMPNIILNHRVIEELVQYRANSVTISLQALDDMRTRLPVMRRELSALEHLLGGTGASARAAACVLELANEKGRAE
jgi:lipid-A-disaccharide synthase